MTYPPFSGFDDALGTGGLLAAGGWTRDAGGVVRLTTVTDQVGVGTATPGAGIKLDIVGVTRTEGRIITTYFAAGDRAIIGADDFVGLNATALNRIATLPAAVTGRKIIVKNTGNIAVVNTVAVTPNGAETIDGVAAAVLLTGTQSITLVGLAGTGWFVI